MDRIPYILLPLLGGALIAAQAPMNARLRVVVGSPIASAFRVLAERRQVGHARERHARQHRGTSKS